MARGSPGGILLIGAGVFLISLGFTGKFAEVWDVITNKVPGMPGPDDLPSPDDLPPDHQPGPGGQACQADPHCPPGMKCVGHVCTATEEPGGGGECATGRVLVTLMSNGAQKCVLRTDLVATEGGQCRNGYVLVNRPNADKTATALCLKTVRGAGASYAYAELPTGVLGLRLQPNVG